MEILPVSRHVIQSSHQGAVVTVQASTQICDYETAVQAKHAGGPWTAFYRLNHLSELDGIARFLELLFATSYPILAHFKLLQGWLGGLSSHVGGGTSKVQSWT